LRRGSCRGNGVTRFSNFGAKDTFCRLNCLKPIAVTKVTHYITVR
jgi:hypothetical protein